MTIKTIILTSVATLAAAAAAPAHASDFKFSYNAHELQTAEGREVVLRRLDARATLACRADVEKALSLKLAAEECRDDLVEQIVSTIDDARLTTLHSDSYAVVRR